MSGSGGAGAGAGAGVTGVAVGAGLSGPIGLGVGPAGIRDRTIDGFQALRQEQRALASKLSELEQELNEHKIVIDTLKSVKEDKKCFQMVGGILFEKTVKEVLPVLCTTRDSIGKVIQNLTEQLTKKGIEINEYREKHDIRIRGQNDIAQQDASAAPATKSNAVLVSNN